MKSNLLLDISRQCDCWTSLHPIQSLGCSFLDPSYRREYREPRISRLSIPPSKTRFYLTYSQTFPHMDQMLAIDDRFPICSSPMHLVFYLQKIDTLIFYYLLAKFQITRRSFQYCARKFRLFCILQQHCTINIRSEMWLIVDLRRLFWLTYILIERDNQLLHSRLYYRKLDPVLYLLKWNHGINKYLNNVI